MPVTMGQKRPSVFSLLRVLPGMNGGFLIDFFFFQQL